MTADRKALLGALALHGLALLAVRALPVPRATVVPQAANAEITLESEVAPAPPPVAPSTVPESTPAPASAHAMGVVARREGERGAVGATTAVGDSEPVVMAPVGSAPTTFEWARKAPIDLGLDGTVRMAQLNQPDKPSAVGAAGGLGEALDATDKARGIWRGGPVRSAVEEAARSPDAPAFGMATFAVAIGKDGNVTVDVMAASSDRTSWQNLAPAVRAALTAKPLRLPPNSGLRVTVRVEASEQFPGGGRPVPPEKQGVAAHGNGFKLIETKDHIDIVLPSGVLTVQGRKCGAAIAVGATGISAGGGCADGVAMRVVAARIVNEERL